jgi:hypothetical protein
LSLQLASISQASQTSGHLLWWIGVRSSPEGWAFFVPVVVAAEG